MAGNSRRSQWLGSLAAGTLAALATLFIWQAGADRAPSKNDQSYLDRASAAAVKPALKPTITVTPPAGANVPAEPARAPRAVGVSNGSYDTKVDGSTFVFGAPAKSANPFSLRFGPVVVRSGDDFMSGGNIGDYDVANGGFEAKRGEIAERYMYDTNRVEQLIVIPNAPAGNGAITVNSPLTVATGQKVEPRGGGWVDPKFIGGGIAFIDQEGNDLGSIYGARVVDAVGRQIPIRPAWTGSEIVMMVPASFVAIAQFPITVDPWVEFASSGGPFIGVPAPPSTFVQFKQSTCGFGTANEPQYVWTDGGSIYLAQYDTASSTWVPLGTSTTPGTGLSMGAPGSQQPDIDCPLAGPIPGPIVTWHNTAGSGTEEIYVRRWTGASWVEFPAGSATGGGISLTAASSQQPRIAIDPTTNLPVIAWCDQGAGGAFEIYLKKFDGVSWVPVNGSASGGAISATAGTNSLEPDVVVDSAGTIYVAWREVVGGATGNAIYVRKQGVATWDEVGVGSATGAGISGPGGTQEDPSIGLDETGNPVVCWRNLNSGVREAYVRRFDGASWVEVSPGSATGSGVTGSGSVTSDFARMASDGRGNFTIGWSENEPLHFGGLHIFAKRSEGGAFSDVDGSSTFPGVEGLYTGASSLMGGINCDHIGRPGIAWTNGSFGTNRFFRMWDGPGIPASLAQQHLDASPILVGAATSESFVRFSGVIQGSSGNDASLEVEFKPVGTPFDGIPTAASPTTPVGSTATATIPVIAGSYHWRAREVSGSYRSGWVSFGGNPEASTDFSAGVAPAAPAAVDLTQRKLDGTVVPFGGTTTEGAIVFRWTPPAPLTEALRLQVSYAVGAPDAVADLESPLSPAGSVAPISISVPLALGAYDWQARVQNSAGLNSGFTPFNAGSPDFTVIAAPPPVAPGAPSALGTFKLDGITATPVPPLFSTESFVTFRATVTGAPGDLNRVQVDYTSPGSPGVPDGLPDAESPLAAPGTVVSITVPVADGSYNWQARQQSSTGVSSLVFTPFAGTPDFIIDSPISGPPPASPAALGQFHLDGTSPLALGSTTFESGAVFQATLPASADMLRLQLEIIRAVVGAPDFTGIPNAESALVPGGSTVGISYPLGAGVWEWRVRTISSSGLASAWVEAAPGEVTDLAVEPTGPIPSAPALGTMVQRNIDLSVVPTGLAATGDTVVLEAVIPAIPGLAKIQFELAAAATPFTGVPDVESAYAGGGDTVQVTLPLAPGGYQWRARVLTSGGNFSGFTEFAAGLGADFSIPAGSAPPVAPATILAASMAQFTPVGVAVPEGGTLSGNTIRLQASIPAGLNRLQVEVIPSLGAFSGTPTNESPLVAGPAIVSFLVAEADGSYRWQARAFSSANLPSATFTEFGIVGAPPADFTFSNPGAVAPAAYAGPMEQRNLDGTLIPVGSAAATGTVVLRAQIPAAVAFGKIQFEVGSGAGVLPGTPDFESPLAAAGDFVSVTVPLAPANYQWQVRVLSASGLFSPTWTEKVAGLGTDFSVTALVPPAAPLLGGMSQRHLDGTTIVTGGSDFVGTVIFRVLVPGAATDLNRIQIDFEATPSPLDSVPDVESAAVPGGSTVDIAVPLPDGSYNWQARTLSSTGLVSAYTDFAGGPPDFFVTAGLGGAAPAAPASGGLQQLRLDGTAILAGGGITTENVVVLQAVVPGASTDLNRIQVDLALIPALFDGVPDLESPLVAGGETVRITIPLGNGSYNWRVRAQSSLGGNSTYTSFPGGPPDFRVMGGTSSPAPSLVAGSLVQFNLDSSPLAVGGTTTAAGVIFQGIVTSASPTDLLRFQVEYITPVPSPFSDVPDIESPLVPSGSLVQLQVPLGIGDYKWQGRAINSLGATSPWTLFNAVFAAKDFTVAAATVPVPAVPAGASLAQLQLDGTPILSGGTVASNTVVFSALVPGAGTELNRIQVDVETGALDTVPDFESPLVAGGSTVSIVGVLPNGSYNWQARTLSSLGAVSAYTAFPGGPADFIIAAPVSPVAPTAPVTLVQKQLDGTVILGGGTTTDNHVVFEVVVPGAASDLNRIQVDFEAGATDGVADVESVLVAGGSTVDIAVPLTVGSYNWAARTVGVSGLASAFTPFAVASPDFIVAAAPGPVTPGAPVALAMDQQNLDGSSIAPSGGTALSNVVVFEVSVPGLITDLNRIQVDVEATGSLDSVVNFESPLVPGGTIVHVQASFANGSYEWQARTQSSMMANSAFTAFTGGADDFVVAQGGPTPPVSAGLTQTNSDASPLASGATTTSNTVLFGGTVTTTPAGGTARLQVEFAAPGGLTGNPSVESPLVPDGTTVSISVPLADGSYEWQARTMSSGGAASAFTAFAGGPTDFVVAVGGGGVPPSAPTGLDQQNLDGSSIPAAGAATGSTVVFEAVVGGAPGSLDRLQVEFNPTGPGFSGVPDVESPLVSAGSTVHIAVPHTPGTFQWQARTQSSRGAVSAFVEYAAGGGTDYIVTSIAGGPAPTAPIALTQLKLDGVTGIAPGGTTNEPVVVFRATLPGALVDLNRLQVEYLDAAAILFTGNPSVESPLVPGGTTVSIVAPIGDGSWQWRARSESSSTAISTWVDFGGVAPGTDFVVSTTGVVPPAPAGLAQQNADGSSIAPGGTAVTDVVRFGATVTSTTGEEVSLQVDFAPVGGLSGTPDIESPLVPPGSLVFITIPLGDGSYEWQARTKAASGTVSAYTAFGGSSGVSTDFVVAAGSGGVTPGVPTGLTQRRLDGTVIPAGGTTSGDTVVFEGTVSGPPGSFLRLEVEYALFGTGLAGVPDVESPLIPTGSTVQIAVALGDGSYEWQARARTSTGAISAFSPAFGTSGVAADFVVAAGSGGVPPAPPSGIGQFKIDGFSAIPAGGIVTDDKLIFRGTVSGLVTNLFRLQVEYVSVPGAFSGNPTVESPLVPGSSLVSISVPIGDGVYMWRARSQASTGASSTWVDFNLPVGIDFVIASAGLTPPPPVGLAQETLSGAPIPAGGTTFSDTVVFRSTVTSSTPGGLVRLQVEFASPSSLGGVPDIESPLVPSGTSVTIAVPLGDGTYEWQARTVSPTGLASAFVPFGGTTGVTDFIVSAGTGGPAPTPPAGLAQRRLDQSLIPAGGTTSGDTVIFESLVTGAPGSLLRLQVEYAISGGGLTGIPDVESVLVPTGSTVQIRVPLGDGSYEWQARTQSSLGAVSAFVEFNPVPAAVDFIVASGVGAIPPGPPTSLEQRTIAGALVPSGGVVSDDTIVFRGTVPAGPLFVRMQVEFVQLPTVFSGVPSVESPLVPGGSVVSITVPIADGVYGWQARAQTSTGGSSGYADFGLPTDTDFIIAAGGTPPPVPAGLAQLDSAGVPIPIGGTTFTNTVQFQAVAAGALPGDLVRLQVDFAAPGSLSGSPDVESPFLPAGSTVTVAVPLGNGSYEWQVRTLGPGGATSAWTEFVAGLSTDFIVDAGSGIAPPAPTALDQLEFDGTSIPLGATVYADTVKFTGVVSTTDGSLAKLQIDFSPLSGVIDVESPLVPSGSTVEITVPLADGSYDWQARTASSTSAVSPFVAFDPASPDFIIDANQVTNPPITPIVLGQQDPLGVAIPVGGDDTFDSVVLFATLPGLPTDLIRLQLEVKPVTDVFTGVPDVQSVLLAGGSTALVTIPLGDGDYHWQARAQRSVGVSSAWVEFGGNPTADIDFTMDHLFPGFPPPAPTVLNQLDTHHQIIPLDAEVPDGDIFFQGTVAGDPAKLFKLQIEVRLTEEAFTGLVTHESMFLPDGSTAEIHAYLGSGPYHWQARTITSSNVVSPWISFGANTEADRDFEISSPQNGADHHVSNTRKRHLLCGLTGFEFPALFGLWLFGRKVVRKVRKGKSAK